MLQISKLRSANVYSHHSNIFCWSLLNFSIQLHEADIVVLIQQELYKIGPETPLQFIHYMSPNIFLIISSRYAKIDSEDKFLQYYSVKTNHWRSINFIEMGQNNHSRHSYRFLLIILNPAVFFLLTEFPFIFLPQVCEE